MRPVHFQALAAFAASCAAALLFVAGCSKSPASTQPTGRPALVRPHVTFVRANAGAQDVRVDSMTAEALDAGGAVVAGPVGLTIRDTLYSGSIEVPAGPALQIRIRAYSFTDLVFQGVSAAFAANGGDTLTGPEVVVRAAAAVALAPATTTPHIGDSLDVYVVDTCQVTLSSFGVSVEDSGGVLALGSITLGPDAPTGTTLEYRTGTKPLAQAAGRPHRASPLRAGALPLGARLNATISLGGPAGGIPGGTRRLLRLRYGVCPGGDCGVGTRAGLGILTSYAYTPNETSLPLNVHGSSVTLGSPLPTTACISGFARISNTGVGGVVITATPGSATTSNNDGSYCVTAPPNTRVTLVASTTVQGLPYRDSTLVMTGAAADCGGACLAHNFNLLAVAQTACISGHVMLDGSQVSGATVTVSTGGQATSASGAYCLTAPAHTSVWVVASYASGGTAYRDSANVTTGAADLCGGTCTILDLPLTAVNPQQQACVSGKLTLNGVAVVGATVSASNAGSTLSTTGGSYCLSVPAGNLTVVTATWTSDGSEYTGSTTFTAGAAAQCSGACSVKNFALTLVPPASTRFSVDAWIIRSGSTDSGTVFCQIDDSTTVGWDSATVTLTPEGGSPVTLANSGGGSYFAYGQQLVGVPFPYVPLHYGQRFTLHVAMHDKAQSSGSAVVRLPRQIVITNPAPQGVVAQSFTMSWTGAAAGDSVFNWAWCNPDTGAADTADYRYGIDMGSVPFGPLHLGPYHAEVWGWTGPWGLSPFAGYQYGPNLVGPNMTGSFSTVCIADVVPFGIGSFSPHKMAPSRRLLLPKNPRNLIRYLEKMRAVPLKR